MPRAEHIAQDFLHVELSNGPRVRSEVIAAAKRAGIRPRTLQRAATALGIQTKRQGWGRGSTWQLPRPTDADSTIVESTPRGSKLQAQAAGSEKSEPAPAEKPTPRTHPRYVSLDDPAWENPEVPLGELMAGVDLDEPTLTTPLKVHLRLPSLPRHALFPWKGR